MQYLTLTMFFLLFFCHNSFAHKKSKDFKRFGNNQTVSKAETPVKILFKPRANYPQSETGTICMQGTVSLRIQFLDTGEIGEIKIINGLPYGANENAIEAAKKIKFNPARINGKSVTKYKIAQFAFTIY